MLTRYAAVNVDVDSLYLYCRIHDLDESTATNVVWERGIPRFAALFNRLEIKATFFVVTQDLLRWPEARAAAEALVAQGHELASHTHQHPYDFTRMSHDDIAAELDTSYEVLSEIRSSPVSGFRAPGYNMTPEIFEILENRGYLYDSSIFPSPPYYIAKALVLSKMWLTGKKSQSILGRPGDVFTRKSLPHARGNLTEFPITVIPGVRFPVIGTSLLMLGDRGYSMLRSPFLKRPFVNLEFHGIDLCDLVEDEIDSSLLKQPDLRKDIRTKSALFERVLTDIRDHYDVHTLESLATAQRWE